MKPAPFEFRRASSVAEAVELVAGHPGHAKFLAGGQTMGPMINLRLVQPDLIVDISRLDELRQVVETPRGIRIGAARTHAEIEDGAIPDVVNGMMQRVAAGIAYRAVRNRGTLGGSLAHADPSAEWPTVMALLGATLHVRSAEGTHALPIEQFFRGPMLTALSESDIILAIEIPRSAPSVRWGFVKRCRKVGEFAYALAGVVSDRERRQCRAMLGATGNVPLHLTATSDLLAPIAGWRDGLEAEIRAAYEADVEAAGVAFDDYDRHVSGVAVVRAARGALAQ